MRKQMISHLLSRILVIFLSITCLLPNPTFALHTQAPFETQTKSGLEESLRKSPTALLSVTHRSKNSTTGLEEDSRLFPDPVVLGWHPGLTIDAAHTTYLNRDLAEEGLLINKILPDLVRRNADSQQITVAFLGISTGEEMARFWHWIRPKLPEGWRTKFIAVERDLPFLDEARKRFKGESPFVYAKVKDAQMEAVESFSKEIVRTIQMDADLLENSIEWVSRDMTDPDVVSGIVQEADLIVSNTAAHYLPDQVDRNLRGRFVRALYASPKAWILTADRELFPRNKGHRFMKLYRLKRPEMEPSASGKQGYLLSAPRHSERQEHAFLVEIPHDITRNQLKKSLRGIIALLVAWLKQTPLFAEGSPFVLDDFPSGQLLMRDRTASRVVYIELWEAIKNAIDEFSRIAEETKKPYRGLITARVWREDTGEWVLELSDNGAGISLEFLEQLFLKRYPGERKDSSARLGWKGLAFYDGDYGDAFIEDHHGKIEIDTKNAQTGAYRLIYDPVARAHQIEPGNQASVGTTVRWIFYMAGLEEKRVAVDVVAERFRDAVHEVLGGSDLASVVLQGRGVILDTRIGDGVLSLAAALAEVDVSVIVVESAPEKQPATERLLGGIPVVSDEAAARIRLAELGIKTPIILTPAVTPNPEAAFAYLKELRLLPRDLQPQAILAVGLEEGRFREQVGKYL